MTAPQVSDTCASVLHMTNSGQLAKLPATTTASFKFSDGVTRPAGTRVTVPQWAIDSRQDYVTAVIPDTAVSALVPLLSVHPA